MAHDNFDVDRRGLAKAALLGAAAAALPAVGRAQTVSSNENLVFTRNDPGHWADVKGLHVPSAHADGSTLTVNTPHPMSPEHYIVSHTAVLDGGKYLGRKNFTPTDRPTSVYTLPEGYQGKVTVTSTCNLHDFWVDTITI